MMERRGPRRSASTVPSQWRAVLDSLLYVRHLQSVITNTRNFLRDFTSIKAKARKGETVHVRDKEGEFLFTSAFSRRSLLGAARGKIVIHGDLTAPTLPGDGWKPSL